jgi:translation initiation factor IF-2
MDDVRNSVAELLPPVIEKKVVGEANVLQIFEIRLKAKETMKVAGSRVFNGVVHKNKNARVVRDGRNLFEGMVS